MVIDEDLETHIVEGERCQGHPRTHSSQVSCHEGSLRVSIPQTHIQRHQLRPRHQQHQRPHPRPPHRARFCLANTAYFNWSLWTSHRTLLASLSSNIFFGDNKRGRGNSSLNSCFIVHKGRVDLRKEDDTVFRHTPQIDWKNVAKKLLHGGFLISFMKFIIILIFIMTDLCASNDVIILITIRFSKIH